MEYLIVELTYFVVCFIFLILGVLTVIFTLFMNSCWFEKIDKLVIMFMRATIVILGCILILICILMLTDSYSYLIKSLP